jgi:Uma2 family endonuclease
MVALPSDRHTEFTVEAYLKFEDDAPVKHEYYKGEIFAMAGASPNHVQISSNTVRRLSEQMDNRPECRAWGGDMRVQVTGTIYFYPDAIVVCNPQYTSERHLMLTNPALIVEVTSSSTALYDRTTKLEAYKRMPSVQEVLIVDQHRVHVDQYTRSESIWTVREHAELTDTITLESIGCALSVGDVYAKVTFTD